MISRKARRTAPGAQKGTHYAAFEMCPLVTCHLSSLSALSHLLTSHLSTLSAQRRLRLSKSSAQKAWVSDHLPPVRHPSGLFIRPLDHLGQHRAQPPLSPVRLSPLSCSRAAASPFSCYLAPPLSPSPVHLSPHSCSRAARHFAKFERANLGNLATCPWRKATNDFFAHGRPDLANWQTANPTQIRGLL